MCALVLPPEPGAELGKAGRIPRDAHDLFADMNTDGEYGSMDFRHLRAGVCACDTEEIAHCELRAVIADTKNEAVQCSQKTHESKCGTCHETGSFKKNTTVSAVINGVHIAQTMRLTRVMRTSPGLAV